MNNTSLPFLIRLFVNAAALWVATRVVPGASIAGAVLSMLVAEPKGDRKDW